ncbi:hypothetical protein STCU_00960 [Strigomonas culicis]|uniref:Uncharacterized protein n=1 Tax=Strigomonas culicis TaxID=28005 RepID=S9V9A9_9TRYP|nr:hypothetical protein STCU_07658 [Strigomonas culicis]EPY35714.1 hypothetical protein STCU_00960 [Strigomonas culicis]|eukprot:EPY23561.1 hypothetical protein STCU_07658 [Strigomonas culicis]
MIPPVHFLFFLSVFLFFILAGHFLVFDVLLSPDAFLRNLKSAVYSGDAEGVEQMLARASPHMRKQLETTRYFPFFLLTEMHGEQPLSHLTRVLWRALGEPNGDGGDLYHPLTAAYRHGQSDVADELIKCGLLGDVCGGGAAPFIFEVFSHRLRCADLEQLDPLVKLVVTRAEGRTCMRGHPHAVAYDKSDLKALFDRKHDASFVPSLRYIAGREEFRDTKLWSTPFQAPVPNHFPPREQLVMNPEAFEDFHEAYSYYFFGSPWSQKETFYFVNIVSLIGLVALAAWVSASFFP